MKLHNCIGFVRQEKNMSQEELADLAGCSRTSITSIESGRQVPSVFLAFRIADALDVDIYDIFSYNLEES